MLEAEPVEIIRISRSGKVNDVANLLVLIHLVSLLTPGSGLDGITFMHNSDVTFWLLNITIIFRWLQMLLQLILVICLESQPLVQGMFR